MSRTQEPLTELIARAEAGDAEAKNALFAALYQELHRLAPAHLRRVPGRLTLSTTTLLHEAYLGIAQRSSVSFPDRNRFLGYAARAMRGLIVDYVRQRRALKRGGELSFVELDAGADRQPEASADLERLSDALGELAQLDPALAELVDPLLAAATLAHGQTTDIGLSSVRAQRFGNEDLVGFDPAPGDHFAWALVAGDFNGDGADELVTGIAYDDGITGLETPDCGGAVARDGVPGRGLLGGEANRFLRQTPAVNPAEIDDRYAYSLAACDFNGDGFDDLAVGIDGEDHLGEEDAGAVQIHYGSATGLPGTGHAFHTQSTPGVPGDVETQDRFGFSVACGDFDDDGFDDLAIGVPAEDLGLSGLNEGMVVIIPGSAAGLDPLGSYHFDQDVGGMAELPGGSRQHRESARRSPGPTCRRSRASPPRPSASRQADRAPRGPRGRPPPARSRLGGPADAALNPTQFRELNRWRGFNRFRRSRSLTRFNRLLGLNRFRQFGRFNRFRRFDRFM